MTKKEQQFNDFRFKGLEPTKVSNKYLTMNRINADETKVVVKVADVHLVETRYGYALILNANHVVFLKSWQVSRNWFGNEVLLTKEYFNVKEWGNFEDFGYERENETWEEWVELAKEQSVEEQAHELDEESGEIKYYDWVEKVNPVKWEI